MTQNDFDSLGEPAKYLNKFRGGYTASWYLGMIDGKPKNLNMPYSRYVYQKHHGVLPDELIVINKDGDKTNTDINNLKLRSKCQQGYKNLAEKRVTPNEIINGIEYKFCTKCKQLKKLDRFATRNINKKIMKASWCMKCFNASPASKKSRKKYLKTPRGRAMFKKALKKYRAKKKSAKQ